MSNQTASNRRKNSPEEAIMASVAEKAMTHEDKGIVPGRPLPEGFVNPEGGDPGHLCLDIQGKYRPNWKQLLIIEGDQTGKYQSAGCGYNIKVGIWVDVPPEIASVIANCIYEEVEQNPDNDPGFTRDYVPRTVRKIPRFNYRIMDSA